MLKIIFYICFGLISHNLISMENAPELIALYKGEGSDPDSVEGLRLKLKKYAEHIRVLEISNFLQLEEQLKSEKRSMLLIMPGGGSRKYEVELSRYPNVKILITQRIREQSLSYLGICAGAYFAAQNYSSYILIDGEMRAMPSFHQRMRLDLFPAMRVAFDFRDISTCYPEAIQMDALVGNVPWYFGAAIEIQEGQCILARYVNNGAAAIAAEIHERNIIIVSGVHFELDENIQNNISDDLSKHIFKLLNIFHSNTGLNYD